VLHRTDPCGPPKIGEEIAKIFSDEPSEIWMRLVLLISELQLLFRRTNESPDNAINSPESAVYLYIVSVISASPPYRDMVLQSVGLVWRWRFRTWMHHFLRCLLELTLTSLPLALGPCRAANAGCRLACLSSAMIAMYGRCAGPTCLDLSNALVISSTLVSGYVRSAHFDHHRKSGSAEDPDFDVTIRAAFGRWHDTFLRRYSGWKSAVYVSIVALYWLVLDVRGENPVVWFAHRIFCSYSISVHFALDIWRHTKLEFCRPPQCAQ
jgi:hypothetical protein